MNAQERLRVFRSGLQACRDRRFGEARNKFRLLVADGSRDPHHVSFYGLLLARDRCTVRDGIELCQRAVTLGGGEPQLYLNLARAYTAGGLRMRAVKVLRQGLRYSKTHRGLQREIQRLSPRGDPVLGSLSRNNVLNKYLGRFRSKLRDAS